MFQFTHPFRVRHDSVIDICNIIDVSIHAPLKGATATFLYKAVDVFIVSIHAPLKGATKLSVTIRLPRERFNSRTPKGCDCGGYRLDK